MNAAEASETSDPVSGAAIAAMIMSTAAPDPPPTNPEIVGPAWERSPALSRATRARPRTCAPRRSKRSQATLDQDASIQHAPDPARKLRWAMRSAGLGPSLVQPRPSRCKPWLGWEDDSSAS
jgi:hypothetical protein